MGRFPVGFSRRDQGIETTAAASAEKRCRSPFISSSVFIVTTRLHDVDYTTQQYK